MDKPRDRSQGIIQLGTLKQETLGGLRSYLGVSLCGTDCLYDPRKSGGNQPLDKSNSSDCARRLPKGKIWLGTLRTSLWQNLRVLLFLCQSVGKPVSQSCTPCPYAFCSGVRMAFLCERLPRAPTALIAPSCDEFNAPPRKRSWSLLT